MRPSSCAVARSSAAVAEPSAIHTSAAAYQSLAQILMRLGRTDEARKEMEMAKALGRSSVEAR